MKVVFNNSDDIKTFFLAKVEFQESRVNIRAKGSLFHSSWTISITTTESIGEMSITCF